MDLTMRTIMTCTVAAVFATFASVVAVAGPSPTNTSTSTVSAESTTDRHLAHDIDARLKADPHHFFRHVNVSVHDGVARLGGFVYTNDALDQARKIAGDTPGITRVDDQMKLERNGNRGTP
jgi:osmotically-inducible protein OsmY